MPSPAGAIAGTAMSFYQQLLGPVLSGWTTGLSYQATIDAWSGRTIFHPEVGAVMSAWQKGLLDDKTANQLLVNQGIPLLSITTAGHKTREQSELAGIGWDKVAEGILSRPDPAMLTQAFISKRISESQYKRLMRRAGADGEDWLAMSHLFRSTPSVEQSMTALIRGVIHPDQFDAALRLHGACPADWKPFQKLWHQLPTVGELMEARNRGFLDEHGFTDYLHRLGFAEDESRSLLDGLRRRLPPLTDIIRFAVKEAFTPSVAKPLGYDNEFPRSLEQFANWQGLHGKYPITDPVTGEQEELTPAQMYWRAHWLPISAGQAYTMLHRLRPGRSEYYVKQLENLGAKDVSIPEFTIGDLRRWLRVNDFPPNIRDSLAAVAFRPLRLIDIRQAFQAGIRDRGWFIEQQLDRGVSPDDARTLADIAEGEPGRRAQSAVVSLEARGPRLLLASALDAYDAGTVDRDGVRSLARQVGMREGSVDILMDARDVSRRTKQVSEAVNHVKRQYISGAASREEAIGLLGLLRVSSERATELLALWDLRRTTTRKLLTLAKIQGYVAQGLMPVQEAVRRLTNLGYSEPDRLLLLQEASATGVKVRQREVAAEERNRRARAKDLEAGLKALDTEKRRLRGELARIHSPAILQRWLKAGVITADTYRERMRLLDYPDNVIDTYLREVQPNGEQ